ncbi:sensor histidine kinase [Tessaracoccus caeni]|uniref:sensor histidine kinase n=1 Tax=Tessaracoccus caeni TaxID=3031239 RepID=UPI0023DC4FD2|nr:histidine kinase [Tessaracoccus caeni]MDF1488375.1 histidine kinase [Tessaracoccus caeni]
MIAERTGAEGRPLPGPSAWRLSAVLRDLFFGAAVSIGLWLTVLPATPAARGWQLVLVVTCLVAVLVRAWLPVASAVIATAATVVGWALGVTADPCVLAGLCVFAVAERHGLRVLPRWLIVATVLVGLAMLVLGGDQAQAGLRSVILSGIVLGAAWALGTRTRQARQESAARARSDERLRLSREVHDVLSHSLGTIGVQAGIAAHVSSLDEAQLRATLREVETDARSSLDELRELLRREREDVEHTPGASLSEVIRGVTRSLQRAGIEAMVEVDAAADALPVVHKETIRRIVQEAVTNTIRHSGARSCRVMVKRLDGRVEVTVSDDGHGISGSPHEGHGLRGLRERAALLDGRLDVRDSEAGFTVVVSLPVNGRGVR